MLERSLVAGLAMLTTLCGVTPALAAKINISFTMVHDRLRPAAPTRCVHALVLSQGRL
jgi:hypothetical protein